LPLTQIFWSIYLCKRICVDLGYFKLWILLVEYSYILYYVPNHRAWNFLYCRFWKFIFYLIVFGSLFLIWSILEVRFRYNRFRNFHFRYDGFWKFIFHVIVLEVHFPRDRFLKFIFHVIVFWSSFSMWSFLEFHFPFDRFWKFIFHLIVLEVHFPRDRFLKFIFHVIVFMVGFGISFSM